MLALDEAIPRFLPETDFDLSPFQTGAVFLAALLNAVPEGHVAFCSLLRPPLSLSIDGTSRIEPYETYGRALLRTLPPLPAPSLASTAVLGERKDADPASPSTQQAGASGKKEGKWESEVDYA